DYAGHANAPALVQIVAHGRTWLVPLAILLVAGFACISIAQRTLRARAQIAVGALGFLYLLAQGFAIGPRGLSHAWLVALLGPGSVSPSGLGRWGALADHVLHI